MARVCTPHLHLPWVPCCLADVSMALCRMVAYNIGQLAYMNATRFNLKRVFFGGFFIRGHPYTMETISFAIRFWSKVGLSKGGSWLHPAARGWQQRMASAVIQGTSMGSCINRSVQWHHYGSC